MNRLPVRAAHGSPRRRLAALLAAVITPVIVVTACSESSSSPGAGPVDAGLLGLLSSDSNPSQLAVAGEVPGFGGYFLDANGAPTVYLSDPGQRLAAEQALGAFLASRDFTVSDLRVLPGTFDYAQLDTWYRLARPALFQVPGIVLGDVDEGRNLIRIGVSSGSAASAVATVLAGLGIPSSAVVVEQRAPIRTVATLRDQVRPVQGGLQINFFPTDPSLPQAVSLLCTIGFNAVRFGVSAFVTNSHCSNVEGGEELPTDYYQSLRSTAPGALIGTEIDDPHWTSQLNLDCPPPLACRYSDAALVAYAPGVPATLGRIARIDEITTSLDDSVHTIAGFFTVRSSRDDPTQGEVANKVGRTTGWTRGVTTATCVDIIALGTTHIRLCQAMVGAIVDGGDSGSPVFFRKGNQSSVTLLGILWGGSTDETVAEFAYSPLSGVKRDLGNLRVF